MRAQFSEFVSLHVVVQSSTVCQLEFHANVSIINVMINFLCFALNHWQISAEIQSGL